jgi:predicted Rossmann fold nucleotide-binding protein DprA/Smf involved in DNA uptake
MRGQARIRGRAEQAGKHKIEIVSLEQADSAYPGSLQTYLGKKAPKQIYALGDLGILRMAALGLFCSIKCPGNLILRTYDLARELRDAGVVIMSGFHSPMERECFGILLRGKQPVVWCPARRLAAKRIPKEYAKPLSDGRLLILSPFEPKVKQATIEIAGVRNDFVAALAERIFIAYAVPGGKTETFCRRILEWRKPLFMFDSPKNAALIALGVKPYIGIQSITDVN